MEAKMTDLKKASQCWWFDSHNSAKRSPWLQSTLSELEKKTKCMLNLIGGDADSFAQRAEMYYRKRPELVTMIEDFYRSYRYLAEQHELLRSEAGARRSILFKSDSSNQISYQKTWDSTDTLDYPESEVSEVDNPELEEAGQIESMFAEANEEFEGVRRNLLAKSSVSHVIFNGSAATEPDVQDEINLEVPAKSHKSKRISYSFGEKQMETNQELEHQDEIKLMELPFGMENDQNILKSMNERLEVCPSNTRPILIAPLDFRYSKECEKYCHPECNESISQREIDGYKVDDHETKVLCEMTSEVERLKTENENLMAELEKKDEEKRNVIRQLSLTVEILKEENVNLKRFIKGSKRCSSIFEFKKLKDAFSGTGRLFGLNSQSHPSLVAL